MKTTALTLLPLLAAAALACAAPLQKEHVSADVKWLLHLDVESGLKTQLGQYLGDDLLAPQLANGIADLKDHYGVDLDWRKFQSFTAYGTDFEPQAGNSGVLIVKSSQNIPAMLDAIIAKLDGSAGPGNGPLRKAKDGTYSLKHGAYGAERGGAFVLSKSSSNLGKALDVIDGKEASLAKSKKFAAFPQPAASFFFLGLADGFNEIATLPPQARVLKNSTGGQLAVGEKGGQVFLNLALGTKDGESTAQIQQVFQGLLALAALNEDKNKDLARLARGTKVTTNEMLVSVSVELPATNLIATVKQERIKRGQ